MNAAEKKRIIEDMVALQRKEITKEDLKRKERLLSYLEETKKRIQDERKEHGEKQESSLNPADTCEWPHQSGKKMILLRERLATYKLEIKNLENHMVNADRLKYRKCRSKRNRLLEEYRRMEAACFAAENWQEYFLMFQEDEKLRREDWIDSEFYEKERADLRRKLEPCFEFGRPVEERVFQLEHPEFSMEQITAISEFQEEIQWYAVGCLFLEEYLIPSIAETAGEIK